MSNEGRLDVTQVFVAVADDQTSRVLHGSKSNQELGFGANFQTEVPGAPKFDDLFDDVTLLIDLDREHAAVLPGVFVFVDRRSKTLIDVLDPIRQNVAKANQHGQFQSTGFEVLHEVVQVDILLVFVAGSHLDVARVVDAEVRISPAANLVQASAVLGGPLLRLGIDGTKIVTRATRGARADQRAGVRHAHLLPKPAQTSKTFLPIPLGTVPKTPVARQRSQRLKTARGAASRCSVVTVAHLHSGATPFW